MFTGGVIVIVKIKMVCSFRHGVHDESIERCHFYFLIYIILALYN